MKSRIFDKFWSAVEKATVRTGYLLPDKLYISIRFRARMGYWPDLRYPRTFNEKLNWLKIHNRRSEYTNLVDKISVKEYVSSKIGAEYVIPTIGIWDTTQQIEWDKLPERFVLKTSHGGGGNGVAICSDATQFDKAIAIQRLEKSLKTDIYRSFREWPYKNVERRVLAEPFIESYDGKDLRDYKFFCFNGIVKCFKIDYDRFVNHHANYYSPDGNLLPFGEADLPPIYDHEEIMPNNLGKMIELAESLSAGQPFMRVDLYNVDGKIYFGEITFFPAAGMGRFTDEEWDKTLGSWIDLNLDVYEE